jgi:hypothetical protein
MKHNKWMIIIIIIFLIFIFYKLYSQNQKNNKEIIELKKKYNSMQTLIEKPKSMININDFFKISKKFYET